MFGTSSIGGAPIAGSSTKYSSISLFAEGADAFGAALVMLLSTAYPTSDVSDGTWTDQAGGSNLYAAIDETTPSDADYIKSAELEASGSDVCEVALDALGDAGLSTDHVVRYRYRKQGAATMNLSFQLRQGTSTVIASWSHNGIGTDWVDGQYTLSEAEANSITDYSDLRVRITASVPA